MKIKSIIFDNDGTLYRMPLRFKEIVVARMADYLSRKLGIPQPIVMDERKKLIAKHGVESTEFVFQKEYGIPYEEFVRETYLTISPKELGILTDGRLRRILEASGLQKSVLTNNPAEFARRIINALGICDMFEHIIGSREMDFKLKPNIEAFLTAMQIAGYDAKTTMFVDDVPEFHPAAKQLGMTTVLLGQIEKTKRPYIDFTINQIYDIEKILEEIR